MKERNATSTLARILTKCTAQAKDYGGCVAAKVPEIERDMCLKEFLVLKNCMQNTLEKKSTQKMSGRASSSLQNVGFSGSGGLSHVYIQYPPLRCSIPGSRGLYYDDGSRLMLAPTSDQVFSWKTVPFDPHVTPSSDPISEGPILSIRYSLDSKFIAIQRSSQEIQFWHRETNETFSYKLKSESGNILGFFWTDCPLCNFVLVRTSGLDFLAFDFETKSLDLVETRRMNVNWYVYTHESRLVLLASGMQCKTFTGFQLSSAGVVRLPKFDMAMAKSDANNKPVLAAEDIYIITVYGRIYCLQIDRVAMLLHSYRFYRDAVVQQGSLPIYSSKIAVSVVDNVLLVHQVDAKVVILYDIFADSRAPISAPLPLLFRGFPRSSSNLSIDKNSENSESNLSDRETIAYSDDWMFLVPDLICDVANNLLWKINLDLEAISASSSEVSSVLEFLQRRKLDANKAKHLCVAITRNVILERGPINMVAKAIDVLVTNYSHSIKTGTYFKGAKISTSSEGHFSNSRYSANRASGVDASAHTDNETLNRFSNLSTSDSEDASHFESMRTTNDNLFGSSEVGPSSSQSQSPGLNSNQISPNVNERRELQLASPAISPDEMYSFVFAPAEEEMVGDPSYLVSVIVEFLRSTNSERIKVHPNVYVLTIQLLARSERYTELALFILNKVLEPSKEVAMQLLELGRQNSQIRKLGLDMLRQLSSHHDYVVLLVQDGYYLEALRYVRKHKVTSVRPSLFLEAASASNDSQHLAAVLRFFSDFIPGFVNTVDHHTYYRFLNEMNLAVAS